MNSAFRAALLDPTLATPAGVINPDGQPATKRFAVYRNNVAVGLSDALELSFPVLRQVLGPEFFRAMAGVFWRAHPPQSPLMMFYGTDMPAFLAGFPPVAHLPYLPDVARLELAVRTAYHAADAAPVDPTTLARLSPDATMAARLKFAPAVQLVTSDWPIHAIWQANTTPDAPRSSDGATCVLLTRPGFDPVLHPLATGAAIAVRRLIDGQTLGAALAQDTTDLDITALLTLLLTQGAISALI